MAEDTPPLLTLEIAYRDGQFLTVHGVKSITQDQAINAFFGSGRRAFLVGPVVENEWQEASLVIDTSDLRYAAARLYVNPTS